MHNRTLPIIKRLLSAVTLLAVGLPQSLAASYDAKPKLVVILVFDQFRGDYLDRYRADFKAKNGFNLFLKQGAHFTDCYYDYANLVTAAGHATIGTGAYTDGHQIPLNEWYEQGRDGKLHQVSSVADDRYKLVGAPAGTTDLTGASAHREMASTLGDELVLATGGRARVYGVSMKDRAAILTSGHASKVPSGSITPPEHGRPLPTGCPSFLPGPQPSTPAVAPRLHAKRAASPKTTSTRRSDAP